MSPAARQRLEPSQASGTVSDMKSNQVNGHDPVGRRSRRLNAGKRAEILDAATERFGRDGYEDTKWADIASDVGVGPTALYHYFESKQHCLFVILDLAIEDFRARFELCTAGAASHHDALVAVLHECFNLTDQE